MARILFGSLRSKITFGYVALGALFIGLTIFAFVQLDAIERQVGRQRSITAFFDAVGEVRGLEKNLFLYRKQADFKEAGRQLANAVSLIEAHRQSFEEIAPAERIQALQRKLESYSKLLTEYWQLLRTRPAQAKAIEDDIREARADFLEEAEDLARSADRALAEEMSRYRWSLVGSIGVVALVVIAMGQLLAKRIAQPLKDMERSMERIANGQLGELELRTTDKEIASLTNAFNHVLAELQARQQDMLRSEKLASLGTMLSGVAHELNNPLSNISTSTQILIEELEQPTAPYHKELLLQIDDQTERARRIVSTLLEFARERASQREPVALRGLLEETLRLFGGQVPANVSIRLNVPEYVLVHVDKQRLQQAFLNLIKNAVEASPGGGEVCVTAASFGPSEKQNEFQVSMQERFAGLCEGAAGVDIEIRDQGTGIPAELLPHIFDPFFSTKDVGKGVGLGLFVVHEIVTEHGGCIVADSHLGLGTRFFIRLPDAAVGSVKQREAA